MRLLPALALLVFIVFALLLALWPEEERGGAPGDAPASGETERPPELRAKGLPAEAEDVPAGEADVPVPPRPASLTMRVAWPERKVAGRTAEVTVRMDGGRVWRERSDARGYARFVGLPAGVARVEAKGQDPLFGVSRSVAVKAGEANEWFVELKEAVLVHGRVLAVENGAPIPRARVGLVHGSPRALTDERGEYRFWDALEGIKDTYDWHAIIVRATRREPVDVRLGEAAWETDHRARLDVRLEAAGLARGVVEDARGRPVPRATVVFTPQGDTAARGNLQYTLLHTTTDERGRYEVDGLGFGAVYGATATAPGHARAVDVEEIEVTSARPEVTVTLRLRPACILRLEVRQKGDLAVPRTHVRVDRGPFARVGKDGVVLFRDLAPGRHLVTVRHGPGERLVVEVTPEAPTRRRIVLSPLTEILGVLRDSAGRPISGATVEAITEGGKARGSGLTRADGAFRLESLPAGRYALRAKLHGTVLSGQRLDVSAPADGVVLVAASLGVLRLTPVLPGRGELPWAMNARYRTDDAVVTTGATRQGANYMFRFPPGSYLLRIMPEGFAPFERAIVVGPGGESAIGGIRLKRGRTLRGRLRRPDGRPVFAATIEARDHTGVSATSDKDGGFRLDHLATGPVVLDVQASEGTERVMRLPAGDAEASRVFVLGDGGVIAGRMLDAKGRGWAGEEVYVHEQGAPRPDGIHEYDVTDAKGRFEIHVGAGRYEVGVDREGKWIPLDTVELRDGERKVLSLRVPPR